MASLDDKVRALAATAGWKAPRPEKDGSYSFRLEQALDLRLFSPDGRCCFLLAELLPLPEAGQERDGLLRRIVGQQAGICRRRASAVALEGAGERQDGPGPDRLVLQSRVELEIPRQEFEVAVRDFLNDLAWWKRSLDTPERGETPSLFSMPGTFLGGVY